MPRWIRWVILALVVAVLIGSVYFASLRRRVAELRQAQLRSEQARRAIEQPKIATPTDVMVKAKFFWASPHSSVALAPVEIELGLSADPVLRAKQILDTLIAGPVNSELRTLPPEATLLEFYLLKDGTAIADFSEALATAIPSGIDSEQMAVDSIARTLEANVPQVRRLKILIHGQETETLAGHLDLTGFFLVRNSAPPAESVPKSPAAPAKSEPPTPQRGAAPATALPPTKNPDPPLTKNPNAPAKLTPTPAPGKLDPPVRKP
ncbi:MAG TPA: GerMN domain-containing protein [Candidatus Dormibacteraeota bacterium]|nr:GerMN domain-containing protein [Candidatus Dormibacteraeota bacterium]